MAEAEHKPLSTEQIQNILSSKKPRGMTTEPRTIEVFYKQNHLFKEAGCDNPDCKDPRPKGDIGRKVVVVIQEKNVCRYCFLSGWLSPNAN